MAYGSRNGTGLNQQMRRFVAAYKGNGAEAAIEAGYAPKSANVTAYKLLKDPRIIAQLEAREAKLTSKTIKSVAEVQEWWSQLMDDPDTSEQGRIKASELLVRSHGGFLDRTEVDHKVSAVLPVGLDKETLILIARGGLRSAQTVTALPAGEEVDDDDGIAEPH